MKIHVIGTRGFPYIQGGVEKHCESLYPLLTELGHKIIVYRRKPYLNHQNKTKEYKKVEFSDIWTLKNKNFETILHSFIAAINSLLKRPDIVHLHNIGPSLVLPLLKLGRLKTVVTYHSPNYMHSKWGSMAKKILMFGEKLVNQMADKVIFVSKTQAKLCGGRNKIYIPNGVNLPLPSSSHGFISQIGATPNKYILAVGRFTPEKGLHDLINTFISTNGEYKLVIAGDADHETTYSSELKKTASKDNRIILTGYISGEQLNQIFTHARMFVLPSHHEGLPIALLEALSYGLPVLVSDIPANKEVNLPDDRYFKCGDIADLKQKLQEILKTEQTATERNESRTRIVEGYNWQTIAEQTSRVYKSITANS